MSTVTKRSGYGVIALLVILAAFIVVPLGMTMSKADGSDDKRAGSSDTALATPSDAVTWAQLIYKNFKGVDEIPEKITSWSPEDLETVKLYRAEPNKESPTAFGPDMGKTPEDVTLALVERLYRDPALNATLARDLGFMKFENSEQAKVVRELHDASKRHALADKVLGYYADPAHELTLVKHKGKYASDEMGTDGSTSNVTSNGESLVLRVTSQTTGKVVSERRTDCGLQKFKDSNPPKEDTPPEEEPPTENPPTDNPGKNPALEPSARGNVPTPVTGQAPAPRPDHRQPTKPKDPPKTYTPPAKPKPKPPTGSKPTTQPTQPPATGANDGDDGGEIKNPF